MSANTSGSTAADRAATFTDEELAYHEAGHAVIHHLLGGTISRVSIDRSDPGRGVHSRGAPPAAAGVTKGSDEVDVRQRIGVLVAGEVALYLHSGERRQVSDSLDRERALHAARAVAAHDSAASAMIDEEWNRVRERLRDPATWEKVEALAAALLRQRVLDGAEVGRVIGSA